MPKITWSKFVNFNPNPSPTPIDEWGEVQKPHKTGFLASFQENTNLRKAFSLILILGLFYNHYLIGILVFCILFLEYGAKRAFKF